MKKIMSLIIVCAMVLSCILYAGALESGEFSDVASDHFAYDAVQYFYNTDVIDGVGDNKFAPNEFVTREQFAKMISIIYNKENYEPKEQTFSDVTESCWSYKYIESVKEYLTGYYPDGGEAFFNPTGRATREDVAYSLVKISGLAEKNKVDLSALDRFKDGEQISVNLKDYVALAVGAGLMQGYENELRPQDGITRAEVATLLFRAIKKPVDTEKENLNKEEKEEEKENIKDTENISDEKEIKTNKILSISGYKKDNIKGKIELKWSPKKETAVFDAELKCYNGAWEYVLCEIKLCEVISVEKTEIKGYFDVTLDGSLRHDNIKGAIIIEDDTLKLNTEEYDYKLVVKTEEKSENKEDKKEEKEDNEDNENSQSSDSKRNIIFADRITEFKIINTDDENVHIQDEAGLSGWVRMKFGKSGADTKVTARITVDNKDEYYIESEEVTEYKPLKDAVRIGLNYSLYKNDKLLYESENMRIYAELNSGEITIRGRAIIFAEDISWITGELPQDTIEETADVWDDSDFIEYLVKINDKQTGRFKYIYKEEISKIESEFEVDGKKYKVELLEEISKMDDELVCRFKVIVDGKVISENTEGKVVGYNKNAGEYAELILDDGSLNVKMQIAAKTVKKK